MFLIAVVVVKTVVFTVFLLLLLFTLLLILSLSLLLLLLLLHDGRKTAANGPCFKSSFDVRNFFSFSFKNDFLVCPSSSKLSLKTLVLFEIQKQNDLLCLFLFV